MKRYIVYMKKKHCAHNYLRVHVSNIVPVREICFFFGKICKMSEIGIPWWFRTLRSTSSSKTATGNTFLGFRKLVTLLFCMITVPPGWTVIKLPTPFQNFRDRYKYRTRQNISNPVVSPCDCKHALTTPLVDWRSWGHSQVAASRTEQNSDRGDSVAAGKFEQEIACLVRPAQYRSVAKIGSNPWNSSSKICSGESVWQDCGA